MTPAAGIDFGNVAVGSSSAAQTISVLNDPNLTSPQTVSLVGKVLVSGNYTETDDCPATLAQGASCNLSVIFKPKAAGFNKGSLTINYTPEPTGEPQTVHLRGTGQ
jgi:hypothetical protein